MVRLCRLCVKAVTDLDSVESTEITEWPGPNLQKMANNYDLPIPVSDRFSMLVFKYFTHYKQDRGNGSCWMTSGHLNPNISDKKNLLSLLT